MNLNQKLTEACGTVGAAAILIVGGLVLAAGLGFGWSRLERSGEVPACIAGQSAPVQGCVSVLDPIKPIPAPAGMGDAIVKHMVAHEVEDRERTKVQSVTLVSPGVAHAVFTGGSVDMHYDTNTPECAAYVSDEKYETCLKSVMNNPLGFRVLSYQSKRASN